MPRPAAHRCTSRQLVCGRISVVSQPGLFACNATSVVGLFRPLVLLEFGLPYHPHAQLKLMLLNMSVKVCTREQPSTPQSALELSSGHRRGVAIAAAGPITYIVCTGTSTVICAATKTRGACRWFEPGWHRPCLRAPASGPLAALAHPHTAGLTERCGPVHPKCFSCQILRLQPQLQ